MLLQEANRTLLVSATVNSGEFTYSVDYSVENGKIKRLNCDVFQTKVPTEEPEGETQDIAHQIYLGHIILESGNKNIVLMDSADITTHLEIFDNILDEAKGLLVEKE